MTDEGTEARERVEESFPWAEWDIVDDTDDSASGSIVAVSWENVQDIAPSEQSTRGNNNDDTSDAEEAYEHTDRVQPQTLEASSEGSLIRHEDESDGVSVISESDKEEPESVDDVGSRVVVYTAAINQSTEKNNGKEVIGGHYCLLIGCCILVAVGAGLASKLYTVDTFSSVEDGSSTKMQRLRDCVKEFDSAETILETIKLSLMEEKTAGYTEENGRPLEFPSMKQTQRRNSGIHVSEAAIFNRFNIFFHFLCLALDDDVFQSGKPNSRNSVICGDPRSFFSDAANLRKMLDGAIEEMGEPIESANRKFLEKMDSRIASMSDSFVSDLTETLMKLRFKNEKKLEKINRRMRERLCVLRNTMPSDSDVRRSLEANTTLLENCDETMSKKFERKAEERPRTATSERYNSTSPPPNSNDSSDFNRQNCVLCDKTPRKVWRAAKKRYSEERSDPLHGSPANSCSQFPIPNRSSPANEDIVTAESRPKDSRSSRASSKKTKDKDRTDRKRNNSPLNGRKKNIKKTISPEVHVRTAASESADENSHIERNERLYPTKPPASQYRAKAWANEATREIKKDDARANGQWQFARSQIRDQLRRYESTDNWYFDRVRNRKNSRMNVNDDVGRQR